MILPSQDFQKRAADKTADLQHRKVLQKAIGSYNESVYKTRQLRFTDWQQARTRASQIKWDAINHLHRYLLQFEEKLVMRGTKVFWAQNGEQACDYILSLAKSKGVKKVVKSKSMTTEEIHLGEALEHAGIESIETDLGEYIVQLRNEPPYHIVTPAMHLTVKDISDLFHEKLGTRKTENAEELAGAARNKLREEYCQADMGITGANFAVAETGMISITENEGNARLSCSLPKIHVAVVGIEKVIPKLSDLALFLPLLATSGTGQTITCYNSMIGGPRQNDEIDGPEEFHVVLLDNKRTELLADPEQRESLHCIRCGACLNACPIFKNVGGHSYGTTYQGPIGSVITPHYRGLEDYKHLSYASSLCGNCSEVCPVHIDLHHHLLHNRRNSVDESREKKGFSFERLTFRLFVWFMMTNQRYRMLTKFLAPFQRLHLKVVPSGASWDLLKPWRATREFPPMAKQTFKDYWKTRPKKQER